jgi:hypothetical protein
MSKESSLPKMSPKKLAEQKNALAKLYYDHTDAKSDLLGADLKIQAQLLASFSGVQEDSTHRPDDPLDYLEGKLGECNLKPNGSPAHSSNRSCIPAFPASQSQIYAIENNDGFLLQRNFSR